MWVNFSFQWPDVGYDIASDSDDDDEMPVARRPAASAAAPAARPAAAPAAGAAAAPAAAPAASREDRFFSNRALTEVESLMKEKYGTSLARQFLLAMRCHDAYKRWRNSIDVSYDLNDEGKAAAALESVVSAVDLTSLFDDACQSVSRTWIFHGLIYIIPLFMRKHGSLWPFSSAKLEARGARLKPMWRKQTCKRRAGAVQAVISKRNKEGRVISQPKLQKYSQMPEQQLLASTKLREQTLFGSEYLGGAAGGRIKLSVSRKSSQLRKLGRTKSTKLVREVETAFAEGEPALAPVHLHERCESVMLRILKGEQLPYYRSDGRPELASRTAR